MYRTVVRRGSTFANAYRASIEHADRFWSEQAQKISWFKKWKHVYNKDNLVRPHWFEDGQLNMTYNCLDRHIPVHGDQCALIHDSAMTKTVTHVTYKQLLQRVKSLANVLSKTYGVKKGDVVLIYMPMIPEAVVAMLACARIGAVHNLVFGGFSANELAVRIKHSTPKVLISGRWQSFLCRTRRRMRCSISERRLRTATRDQLQSDCGRGHSQEWRWQRRDSMFDIPPGGRQRSPSDSRQRS